MVPVELIRSERVPVLPDGISVESSILFVPLDPADHLEVTPEIDPSSKFSLKIIDDAGVGVGVGEGVGVGVGEGVGVGPLKVYVT